MKNLRKYVHKIRDKQRAHGIYSHKTRIEYRKNKPRRQK